MKYIIFDIDGTLTDTTKVDDQCYIQSFEQLFDINIKDCNWTEIANVTDWGIAEELVLKTLHRPLNREGLMALKRLFLTKLKNAYQRDPSQFRPIEGALHFYKSVLQNDQLHIGIATGGWEESATFKLNAIGIDPNRVHFSNSNYFKTREEIITDVIQRLHMRSKSKPQEIIYFGDGEWDFKTCRKLNIRFIGIDRHRNNRLKKLGAVEVYENFLEPEIIMQSILQ